ncbi:MAG: DUF3499 domain-containing protein [Propionibacteriaceae bacterium]|nr:DUF3499 domain-containing protein [Propionibacteriaceae bacterium]
MTCSRPGCSDRAVAQVDYAYRDLEVEIRPVTHDPDPNAQQLCQAHLDRLSLPKGWRLIKRQRPLAATMTERDIAALAQEIRRVGGIGESSGPTPAPEHSLSSRTNLVTLTSRAHLRVVADVTRYGH